MDTSGRLSEPTYQDYLDAGFVALLCKGYHPKHNPARDYKTAKEPAMSGWNKPGYSPPTLQKIAAWEKAGGWIGWKIPKGVHAIDVEDPQAIARVRALCRALGIEPAIHVTNNGLHFLFRTNIDLPGDSGIFTKCGLKVTYRSGGKNYLILAPTNGRAWELWQRPEELHELPEEFLPYDRKNADDVLNCLSWQVGKAYRDGHFSGYDDLDAAFMALLIDCQLSSDKVHATFRTVFGPDYDERQTDTMCGRTRTRLENGDPVIGAGTFIQKVKECGLKEVSRFLRELEALGKGEKHDEQKRRAIPFLTPGQLLSEEFGQGTREDLVEDLIPKGAVIALIGLPGHLKTFLAMLLALAVAMGGHFLGRKTLSVPVFYFDRENPHQIWCERLGILSEDPTRVENFHIWPYWEDPEPPQFPAQVYIEVAKANPDALFIFDSFVKFKPSAASENSPTDMAPVMDYTRGLTRFGGTVFFLHHKGKGESDYRGTTEILAGVDIAYAVEKDQNGKRVTLKCIKNRFAPEETIVIEIDHTDGYMVFRDASELDREKRYQEKNALLQQVGQIIRALEAEGKEANQTNIIDRAKHSLGLGRPKVTELLKTGLGRLWTLKDDVAGNRKVFSPFAGPYKGGADGADTPQDQASAHGTTADTDSSNNEKPCSSEEKESVGTPDGLLSADDENATLEDLIPEDDPPDPEVLA